jgi:hypothetical protein
VLFVHPFWAYNCVIQENISWWNGVVFKEPPYALNITPHATKYRLNTVILLPTKAFVAYATILSLIELEPQHNGQPFSSSLCLGITDDQELVLRSVEGFDIQCLLIAPAMPPRQDEANSLLRDFHRQGRGGEKGRQGGTKHAICR